MCPHFMFSGTHLLKREASLGLLPEGGFQGTWQRSDEAGAEEDRGRCQTGDV